MSNVGLPGLLFVIFILLYFVLTIVSIIRKRNNGISKFKTAISMFVFGAFSILGMIFGFIEYSNASKLRANDAADAISSQIIILLLIAMYLIIGGFYLIRKSEKS
jgi:hypothetical protein